MPKRIPTMLALVAGLAVATGGLAAGGTAGAQSGRAVAAGASCPSVVNAGSFASAPGCESW